MPAPRIVTPSVLSTKPRFRLSVPAGTSMTAPGTAVSTCSRKASSALGGGAAGA